MVNHTWRTLIQIPVLRSLFSVQKTRTLTILPFFTGILNDFALDITKRYMVEEVVAYAMQQYPAIPGTYSSTNFVVLDYIMEQITG